MKTTAVTPIKMTTKMTATKAMTKVSIMVEMMKVIEIMMERKEAIWVIPIVVVVRIIRVRIGRITYTTRKCQSEQNYQCCEYYFDVHNITSFREPNTLFFNNSLKHLFYKFKHLF